MKGKIVRRSLSMVLSAAMVFGNVSGVTALAATDETEGDSSSYEQEISLVNSDMSSDIWGDGAGWTVSVDDWDSTGASIKSSSYSSDQWMDKPSDGSDSGVNFWFGEGEGVLTLSQEVDLSKGEYFLEAEAMGEGGDFYLVAGDDESDKISFTGYNNWLTESLEFTLSEDAEGLTVKVVMDVEKDGWGYLNNVKLVEKKAGISEDETGDDEENSDDETGEGDSGAQTGEGDESQSEAESGTGTGSDTQSEDDADEDLDWSATDYISNGDFESGDITGWNVEMPGADGDSAGTLIKTDQWSSNATTFLNYWNNNSGEEELSISQSISSLAAGTYKVAMKLDGAEADTGLLVSVSDSEGKELMASQIGATKGWSEWFTFESDEFKLEEDGDVTIRISGNVPASYWGDIDDIRLMTLSAKEEDTSVEAPIYVEKVSAADVDFITGVDVSSYVSEKNSGVKYYDYAGNELSDQGFFDFLADCGVNYVRIRVWNDPTDGNGNTYGGGNCDLEVARKIGVLASNAGMKVLIDFHYSDFWADPGKQTAPKSMAGMSIDEKAEAIEEFTANSLESLLDSGVNVGMVQIGNETNNGVAGESSWENMSKIFSAGSMGVRKVAADREKQILVAVHFTNPESSGRYAGYAAKLDEYGVDYDVFASSYYPYWHGSLENLNSVLSNVANTYDKMVMVAETSYLHTWEDGDGHGNTEYEGKSGDAYNFDISVQGQANSVRSVVNTVANTRNGIGVFYWEPAWIPVQVYDKNASDAEEVLAQNKQIWETYGSGWASSFAGAYDKDAGDWYGGSAVDNEAWFDFEGHPLDSARIFSYIRTGATAPIVVTSVKVEGVTAEVGQDVTLPEKALVNYSDGSSTELEVTWNADELKAAVEAGVGSYEINGTVAVSEEETKAMTCALVINPVNNVKNAGFEDADMSMWTITDANSCVGRQDDSSNVRTGKYCLKFWDDEDISYTAEQTVTLDAGIYKLGTYIEGGDAGSDAKFLVYANVDGGENYSVETGVTGWQNWANPEVTDIVVTKDGSKVVIGVSVQAQAGAWGAWDDFYLYRTGDYEAPEPEDGDDEKAGVTGNWRRRLGATYFKRNDGSYATGLKVIDGKTYYFRNNGTLVRGVFVKFDDGIRYFGVNGAMTTGFVTRLLATYYFDENGLMQTGRVEANGSTYYFGRDGRMYRGQWLKENGKTYYFKVDGRMATGKLRILFWTYRFDENGALIR